MDDLVSGKVRFSSHCEPPLKAGPYKIKVKQRVTDPPKDGLPAPEIFKPFAPPDFEFVVEGPRFALNPADIYSVYPPEGSTGNYEYSLPHVVLARRTIPWEREIDSTTPHRPWLALLLLSAADGGKEIGIPKVEPRNVEQLIRPAEDSVAGPQGLKCEPYELDDPCNTIDLDAELFRRVAPSAEDVDYLAHVREVKTDHKETVSFLTDGSFAVVIGNRFPKAPQEGDLVENRAVLVSLEGMQGFLPGGTAQVPAKKVRLAVLASWAFHCKKTQDFTGSMRDLGDRLRPLRLKLAEDVPHETNPQEAVLPQDDNEVTRYVRAAFSRGYTGLNHHTRSGEKTVSWYRGPLTPVDTEVKARYEFNAVPDGLVRYDQDKGMMDLTYAGAAQLGRLLGLQDRSFAQALSEWRTEVQRQLKERLEREELRRILRSQPADQPLLHSPESKFLELALSDALKRKDAAPERSGSSLEETLRAKENPKTQGTADPGLEWRTETVKELPATVREWLAKRVLLYGVPFLYLVPDERMLPMPSMRFFRIDPLWIKRLLEGACSVGRNGTQADLVDAILADEFFEIAVNGATNVRRRLDEGDAANNNGTGKTDKLSSVESIFPFEGFLLRSPIVRGWQGLEMEAWYGKDGKEAAAPPLRIDRLAPDIMLCIFNGPLTRIEIRQPPEGMHFGASGFQKASARKVTKKDAGKQIQLIKDYGPGAGAGGAPKHHELRVPLRKPEALGVVDVTELKKLLQLALTDSKGTDKPLTFTSAEFAVQMTESPGHVTITVKGNE